MRRRSRKVQAVHSADSLCATMHPSPELSINYLNFSLAARTSMHGLKIILWIFIITIKLKLNCLIATLLDLDSIPCFDTMFSKDRGRCQAADIVGPGNH